LFLLRLYIFTENFKGVVKGRKTKAAVVLISSFCYCLYYIEYRYTPLASGVLQMIKSTQADDEVTPEKGLRRATPYWIPSCSVENVYCQSGSRFTGIS
jgi:hypothetical protein